MAQKKNPVSITYDALWLKIFMDSNETNLYDKDVFITDGIIGNIDILSQLIGNVGGRARNDNFDKDINVVIFSDKMLLKYKDDGYKDTFIQEIENRINASNTPYRKMIFLSETIILDSFTDRAKGLLKMNKKDVNNKLITTEDKKFLQGAIERDENMLSMIKDYKEPKQTSLF